MNKTADENRSAVVRACCAYGALFACSGFNQPFFPIWLAAHQISEAQISIILSLPLMLRIVVTPAMGAFADRSGNRNRTVQVLAFLVLLIGLALGQANGFWPILLLFCAMMLLLQAALPIVDATVLSLVRQGIARNYGRMRLWGSVGFALASVVGGLILGVAGPAGVFTAFTMALAVQFAAFLALPKSTVLPPAGGRADIRLMQQPLLLAVFVITALVLTSQTTFNTFGSIHLRSIGYSDRSIGLLWALATSAEVAMFWAGPRIAPVLGSSGLLALAAGAALLRWMLMSLSPGIEVTALLQLLHAATFSGSYLGLMRFVEANVSDHRGATAQSAFVTILGVMTAAATLAVGPIYQRFGSGAFLAAAILPFLALIILAVVHVRLRAAERTTVTSTRRGKT